MRPHITPTPVITIKQQDLNMKECWEKIKIGLEMKKELKKHRK